jgi:hypothetical protein
MANPDPQKNWQTSDPLITHHLWSGTNTEGTAYQAVVCDLPNGAASAIIQSGSWLIGRSVWPSVAQAKRWVEWVVLGLHAAEFAVKGSVA